MPVTWEEVARAVKRRRLVLGMSQRAAAAAAGVSPTTWQSLEKYHQPVNDHTKLGVSKALRWHPDAIDRFIEDGAVPAEVESDEPEISDEEPDELLVTLRRLTDAVNRLEQRLADEGRYT